MSAAQMLMAAAGADAGRRASHYMSMERLSRMIECAGTCGAKRHRHAVTVECVQHVAVKCMHNSGAFANPVLAFRSALALQPTPGTQQPSSLLPHAQPT